MIGSRRAGCTGDDAIVVTGIGALSAVGANAAALWDALDRGGEGIGRLERFGSALPPCWAATLPAPWDAPERWSSAACGDDPLGAMALEAAREAYEHAALDRRPVAARRIALLLGTSGGGMVSRSRYELGRFDAASRARLLEQSFAFAPAAHVARALGIEGPRLTISTACTSSAQAVAHGVDLLRANEADVVVAGGAEVVAAEFVAGFAALGALCPEPCAPFSEPVGMTIGEGAAFVVMERCAAARVRGVDPLCVIAGYGLSADAYHPTAPDPTGAGLERALRVALGDAGLEPAHIGYVNAHGTGTEANDAAEARALGRVFGPTPVAVPTSSSKGQLGHARGAAGALELVLTILALRHQSVPPTFHFRGPRAGARLADLVVGSRPRPHRFARALSCNAAFGGSNAALVVEAVDSAAERPGRLAATPDLGRGVRLLGHAALGPGGCRALATALRAGPREPEVGARGTSGGLIAAGDVARELRQLDRRGMDRVTSFLTAVARAALDRARVRLGRADRDRAGLFIGASRLPWDSAHEFWESLRSRGFDRASAPAFSRLVMNAPAAAASRVLGLRGTIAVVAGPVGATLRALTLASLALDGRDDLDLALVGGAFELPPREALAHDPLGRSGAPLAEGAACVAAATEAWAVAHGRRDAPVVAGMALGGPSAVADTIQRALDQAGLAPRDLELLLATGDAPAAVTVLAEADLARPWLGHGVDFVDVGARIGRAESNDATALAAAVDLLTPEPGASARPGERGRAIALVSSEPFGGSTAVVLRSSA